MITNEDYAAAKKKAQAIKPKENFMVIYLSYDNEIVMPYKDGVTLMASLKDAELLKGSYGDVRIVGLDKDNIKARIMSYEDYEAYKMAAILNVTFSDIKNYTPGRTTDEIPF